MNSQGSVVLKLVASAHYMQVVNKVDPREQFHLAWQFCWMRFCWDMSSYHQLRAMDFNLHVRGPQLADPGLSVTTVTPFPWLSRMFGGLCEMSTKVALAGFPFSWLPSLSPLVLSPAPLSMRHPTQQKILGALPLGGWEVSGNHWRSV